MFVICNSEHPAVEGKTERCVLTLLFSRNWRRDKERRNTTGTDLFLFLAGKGGRPSLYTHTHTHIHTNTQANKQINKQTNKHTNIIKVLIYK